MLLDSGDDGNDEDDDDFQEALPPENLQREATTTEGSSSCRGWHDVRGKKLWRFPASQWLSARLIQWPRGSQRYWL
jgi:hypothetical protein